MCVVIKSPSSGVVRCPSVCCAIAALIMVQPVADAMPSAAGSRTSILRAAQERFLKAAPKAGGKNRKQEKQRDSAADAQANSRAALANSQAAVASGKDQLSETQTMMRDAAKELRNFEDELERSEPEDSPLARAKSRFESAQKAHKKMVDNILESPEYRAALERLGSVSNRSALDVAKLRSSMVSSDPQVALAAGELSQAREEYQTLRNKLLQGDSGWREAVDKLKAIRKEQAAAEAEVRKARAAKYLVEDQVERAQREARLAEIRKRQAQMQKQLAAQIQKARQAQARRNYRAHPRHR